LLMFHSDFFVYYGSQKIVAYLPYLLLGYFWLLED
jgi:hypothetical protein